MSAITETPNLQPTLNVLKPMVLGPLPKQPLVSILISSHNYAAFLGDAIESCLSQAYNNLEIIICDDGSTDASQGIMARYESRDPRIKAIYQQNGGQALALNSAFRVSAGEIICLLDADDVFLPNKVEQVVAGFAASPDSGFAINRMTRVDKARKYLGDIPMLYRLPSGWQAVFSCYGGPKTVPGLPPCSGLSMRRAVAEAIFPLPAGLKGYADMAIQVLAPLMTPILAIQVPLSEYRIHGANIAAVRTFTEDRLQDLAIYERERWRVWRRYLATSSSALRSFSSPSSEEPPSLMAYAYARFQSDPSFKAAYRAIPADYIRTLPKWYQWYWRISVLLPNWLFRRSFAFVYGQTPAKMLLSRVLSAYRKAFDCAN
jgi:glycosyltransferase involved in cell wall biosynthesis